MPQSVPLSPLRPKRSFPTDSPGSVRSHLGNGENDSNELQSSGESSARPSYDEEMMTDGTPEPKASYWTMPYKDQFIFLVIARMVEPLAYTSLSPYLYFMIRDFGFEDPAVISLIGTLIMSSFALGQTLSAIFWGRFSDLRGRKPAMLLGIVGTAVAVLFFGLSTNIYMAIFGRLLMGMLNGNVGVIRTMVAELVSGHKQYQTRAFAIMPITYNIGCVIGPMIGGMLVNPAERFPGLFGGWKILRDHPYLLPNLFPIPFMLLSLVSTAIFVRETSKSATAKLWLPVYSDPLLKVGAKVSSLFFRFFPSRNRSDDYQVVNNEEDDGFDISDDEDVPGSPSVKSSPQMPRVFREDHVESSSSQASSTSPTPPLAPPSMKEVLTWPVIITMTCYVIMCLHTPTFTQIFPLFASQPARGPEDHRSALWFNGGMGMSSTELGVVLSSQGFIGIAVQLILYPKLAEKIGNARVHRYGALVYPLTYLFFPFLSFLGNGVFSTILCALMASIVILAQSFTFPPMVILVTNATANPNLMGTVHGINHSVSSLAKFLGPFILGNLYSLGVRMDMIGLAFWLMSAISVVGVFTSLKLREWGVEVPI